jgi:hypothetical protein
MCVCVKEFCVLRGNIFTGLNIFVCCVESVCLKFVCVGEKKKKKKGKK